MARLAAILMVSGPVLGFFYALFGKNVLATAATLTSPIIGFPVFLFALRDPRNLTAIGSVFGVVGAAEVLFASPQDRWRVFWGILKSGFRWMALYFAAVAGIAVYFYFFPIGNNPGLALALVGAVVAAALFAVSGVRSMAWFFTVVAFAISIAFFFSGKKEAVKAAEKAEAVEVPRVEKFTLKAGEEVDTVDTGPGTKHWVVANRDWLLLSMTPEGEIKEYRMVAGLRSIIGTDVAGPARARALADGTTLCFERTNRYEVIQQYICS